MTTVTDAPPSGPVPFGDDPETRRFILQYASELVEENARLAADNAELREVLFMSRFSNKALAEKYRRWADELERLPERTS